MADEQNTPNPDETTPIQPVPVADQGPVEGSASSTTHDRPKSPWIRRGLVAAGVVGLVAVSGVAGFAIGEESGDREDVDRVTAQREPDGGGFGSRDGDREKGGHGFGHHDGERGSGHRDGELGGHHDMDGMDMDGMHEDMNGMRQGDGGSGPGRMPGMGDVPTPEDMMQWLEDQGVDMRQFMDQFGPGGMGPGGMRQSS